MCVRLSFLEVCGVSGHLHSRFRHESAYPHVKDESGIPGQLNTEVPVRFLAVVINPGPRTIHPVDQAKLGPLGSEDTNTDSI